MSGYVRRAPTKEDTAGAAAVSLALAIGVGAVTFYLAKAFLAREPLRSTALVTANDTEPSDDPRD